MPHAGASRARERHDAAAVVVVVVVVDAAAAAVYAIRADRGARSAAPRPPRRPGTRPRSHTRAAHISPRRLRPQRARARPRPPRILSLCLRTRTALRGRARATRQAQTRARATLCGYATMSRPSSMHSDASAEPSACAAAVSHVRAGSRLAHRKRATQPRNLSFGRSRARGRAEFAHARQHARRVRRLERAPPHISRLIAR